jgi:hypothetical protein
MGRDVKGSLTHEGNQSVDVANQRTHAVLEVRRKPLEEIKERWVNRVQDKDGTAFMLLLC